MTVSRFAVQVLAVLSAASLALSQEGTLDTKPPQGITTQEIIQRFTAKEKEFKNARKRCTYRQAIKMQSFEGEAKEANSEYQQVADVTFDKNGNKVKNVVFAPQPSMQLSPEDAQDLESRLFFTLSSDELPEYNLIYLGKQDVDELHTYVFDVTPRQTEKGKRYFQGHIWVDDHDFQIVKMSGKSAPDIYPKKKKGQPNLFPRFTTYREQMDGKYWYPTYSDTDDTLHFPMTDVRIKGTVKASQYSCPNSQIANTSQPVSGGPERSAAKPDTH